MTTLLEIYEAALEEANECGFLINEAYLIEYADLDMNYPLSESNAKLILECHNKHLSIIGLDEFNGSRQSAYYHTVEKPLNDREKRGR